ncbi:hypothetical protein PORY_001999 [Pneumocystis oryctolagi]|uniref:Uncharacterized protein n=1 Tax=Pneumocystis oryctolagi TaxID=42067 RepID=A0ACB7CA56_9ASCO|nr:hypothetical protein PORY_001999 [Pneumocystis oryctolagi]
MAEVLKSREKRGKKEFEQTNSRKLHSQTTPEPCFVQKDVEKHSQEVPEETQLALSGESAKLKAQYHRQLASCRELFPDWTEEDILYVIKEASGDFEVAVARISEGRVGKWGEVKKKGKDKSKKQESLQNSTLAGGDRTFRDKGRDPKSVKNREDTKKRVGGRLNGVSRRDRQIVSDSISTWNTSKNLEDRKNSIDSTGPHSNTKPSWPLYQQLKDSQKSCQNTKKTTDNRTIEYNLKETRSASWENLNPSNQDARSVSAWSDAATKASSATIGWGETGSFCVSSTESQSPSVSKLQTKTAPPGVKPSWASLLKQEPASNTLEQQISPVSGGSYRSDENYTNTFSISKLTEKNNHEIINGANHVPIVSKTSLTTSNLESINKENVEHIVSSKNSKNSTNITNQSTNNSTRFHGFNKSHSSKGSYHRHLNQEAPVVMPNSNNISERVEVRFGSLNLAGQENGLFLNREKSKQESSSMSQGISINLHSPVGPTLQGSQSIENSEQTELRQQSEKIYPESSNATQQPHSLSNRMSTLPSNLNRHNQQLSVHEQKSCQYESFDQHSYSNYANYQIQDQAANFRNFSLPGEYQGFYRSEDPRSHFAQGYYDPSVFPRGRVSNTVAHRDTSNMTNEYLHPSRFDTNISEGSSVPSHQGASGSVMPKHISTDPNTVPQHHSSTQGHYHQAQTYPIHPYYNPYAAYYMNQYGYGNYPYTKQDIYNQPQQDYSRSYNENTFTGSDSSAKFNEHRADMMRPANINKSREYSRHKSQNSGSSHSAQWPSQQKTSATNNSLEYTGEKLNPLSHQGNHLQQMQNFQQQSSIQPVYPASSHTYPTHLPQSSQPHYQGVSTSSTTPSVPTSSGTSVVSAQQTVAAPSTSYSIHNHTVGYHGPYQPLNRQDHPNINWTNYISH